jgi:hypothetical protein
MESTKTNTNETDDDYACEKYNTASGVSSRLFFKLLSKTSGAKDAMVSLLADQRLDSLPDASNPFNHHELVATAIVTEKL